jgi:hypothetical protein
MSSHETVQSTLVQQPPFVEGSVWSVQLVRAKPGQTRPYLECLRDEWKPLMQAAKEQGLILDYRILITPLAHAADWDVMITVELPNMAALDNYNEQLRLLAENLGSGGVQCARFHEIVGMKLMREAILT